MSRGGSTCWARRKQAPRSAVRRHPRLAIHLLLQSGCPAPTASPLLPSNTKSAPRFKRKPVRALLYSTTIQLATSLGLSGPFSSFFTASPVTSTLSSHRSRPSFDMLTSEHTVDKRRAHSIRRRWRGVPRVPSSPLSCRVPVSPSESLRVPVLPVADFASEQ
jgi:hypothetical protein